MLQTDHRSITYQPPTFVVTRPTARPRSYSQVLLYCDCVMEVPVQKNLMRIDNAGQLPLEEFLQLYEPVRNSLAYRRLQGQPLSMREQLVLAKLNQLLSTLFDQPRPEPPAVTQEVEEAKLLLHQIEHGQN